MSDSPRVAVVVQARSSSVRLPGKVLMPLAGKPAIVRMLERVARIRCASWRILATSDDPSDDALAEICREHGFDVARGSLTDVLGRFHGAVPDEADLVVRLTGDCPLLDPGLVEAHVQAFVTRDPAVGYVTNAVERTMPDGLDVEVVSRETLARAHREATQPEDREHVLTWVRRHEKAFSIRQDIDLSSIRWTLDTPRDYEILCEIYATLWPTNPEFETAAVYALMLRRPDLLHVAGDEPLDSAGREALCRRIDAHLAGKGADH